MDEPIRNIYNPVQKEVYVVEKENNTTMIYIIALLVILALGYYLYINKKIKF